MPVMNTPMFVASQSNGNADQTTDGPNPMNGRKPPEAGQMELKGATGPEPRPPKISIGHPTQL